MRAGPGYGCVSPLHTNQEKISVCFFGILAVGEYTLSYIEVPGQANGMKNPRKSSSKIHENPRFGPGVVYDACALKLVTIWPPGCLLFSSLSLSWLFI